MIAFSIPATLEIPFTIDGVVINHVVDQDSILGFDEDGELAAVEMGEITIEKSDKHPNAKAAWTAAAAKIDADKHLRIEIEDRLAAFNEIDNSPEALRRELGHLQVELV